MTSDTSVSPPPKIRRLKTYTPNVRGIPSPTLYSYIPHLFIIDVASAIHDIWAASYIADGWARGRQYSEEQKTHPQLVTFDSLPSEAQAHYLSTVESVLSVLIASGWKVSRPQVRKR